MAGGIDENGKPQCNYTAAQWETLKTLTSNLTKAFPNAKIIGHNQLSNKACPCFSVPKWLANGMKPL